MYRRDFYLRAVKPFAGEGIKLEENLTRWWASQPFMVAAGEGLFMHSDPRKYAAGPIASGRRLVTRMLNKFLRSISGSKT
jgi:hypothetical protein